MDFDIDQYAQSMGDDASQDINNFLLSDELSRIEELMVRRRVKADAQAKASDLQSDLCDKISAAKPSDLEPRIRALEASDNKLYHYIRFLEKVRYGVWCTKCDSRKQIGSRREECAQSNSTLPTPSSKPPTPLPNTATPSSPLPTELFDEAVISGMVDEIDNKYNAALTELSNLREQFVSEAIETIQGIEHTYTKDAKNIVRTLIETLDKQQTLFQTLATRRNNTLQSPILQPDNVKSSSPSDIFFQ